MPHRSGSSIPPSPEVAPPAVQRATADGTANFRQRHQASFVEGFYRRLAGGPEASSIGIGTYLGDTDDQTDLQYEAAIQAAVRSGVNLIDTAINYRAQRSERCVGKAIEQLIAGGDAKRDELIVCTKGGYIPLEANAPRTRDEYVDYLRREFIDTEILRPVDIVANGHSLAPRFLRYCIAKSRQNLGLRCIDVYYLHNPGQQLGKLGWSELSVRLRAAIEVLEDAAARGHISVYGLATWDELYAAPDSEQHLSLEKVLMLAREVAGDAHRFRIVQLPLSLAMPQAMRVATQQVGGSTLPAAQAAESLGLTVITSATLMQGRLAEGLSERAREILRGYETDAQRAVAFARGAPGVTAALVGMRRPEHVAENLCAARQQAGE